VGYNNLINQLDRTIGGIPLAFIYAKVNIPIQIIDSIIYDTENIEELFERLEYIGFSRRELNGFKKKQR